ncbi:hypothetical protein N9M03_00115 [bacterium]|nr:hypothetical protein [bacterium]
MIPINWFYKNKLSEEELLDIISPIEYLPSRETWEESKDIQLYIRALCPIHGKVLFISWDFLKNDRDVQVDKYTVLDYEGIRFIKPLNRVNADESLFICTQCRKDSGHALSFLELFG